MKKTKSMSQQLKKVINSNAFGFTWNLDILPVLPLSDTQIDILPALEGRGGCQHQFLSYLIKNSQAKNEKNNNVKRKRLVVIKPFTLFEIIVGSGAIIIIVFTIAPKIEINAPIVSFLLLSYKNINIKNTTDNTSKM